MRFFHGLTIGYALGIVLCVLVVAICIVEYLSPMNEEHDDD